MPSPADPPPALRPGPVARVRSWLVDWAVIGAWLAVLTVIGVVVRLVVDLPAQTVATVRELVVADLLITVATMVPYVVYLSVTEASPQRATLGKRWAGLVVADADTGSESGADAETANDGGGPVPAGRVWLRNLVKAAPWQLAHLGVTRAIFELQATAGLVLAGLSLVLTALCVVPSLTGGRGLHDRVARTRVQLRHRGAEAGRWPGSGSGPDDGRTWREGQR